MSNPLKSVAKVFKKAVKAVGSLFQKAGPVLMIAAAIYTGGAALGYWGAGAAAGGGATSAIAQGASAFGVNTAAPGYMAAVEGQLAAASAIGGELAGGGLAAAANASSASLGSTAAGAATEGLAAPGVTSSVAGGTGGTGSMAAGVGTNAATSAHLGGVSDLVAGAASPLVEGAQAAGGLLKSAGGAVWDAATSAGSGLLNAYQGLSPLERYGVQQMAGSALQGAFTPTEAEIYEDKLKEDDKYSYRGLSGLDVTGTDWMRDPSFYGRVDPSIYSYERRVL